MRSRLLTPIHRRNSQSCSESRKSTDGFSRAISHCRGPPRQQLPDGLDVTLAGVYDLIRRQRNELGHPQDARPEIDREHAFALFHLFVTYLRDIEALAAHVQSHGL